MLAQILVMAAVFALTYGLLRLRHVILVCGKDKRKYYRAYIIGFEETDKTLGRDDNSNGKPGAGETVSEWPTELELTNHPSTRLPEIVGEPVSTVAVGMQNRQYDSPNSSPD